MKSFHVLLLAIYKDGVQSEETNGESKDFSNLKWPLRFCDP